MFEVALIYKLDTHREGIVVAQTASQEAVQTVKEVVLREALKEVAMWQKLDYGCYQMALGELERLRRVFGITEGQSQLAS